MSDKVRATAYLIVAADVLGNGKIKSAKIVSVRVNRPDLRWNEVAVKVKLDLPPSVFERITPEVTIDVPDDIVVRPVVVATAEGEALSCAADLDTAVPADPAAVLMELYCPHHRCNHTMTAGQIEKLVYALQAKLADARADTESLAVDDAEAELITMCPLRTYREVRDYGAGKTLAAKHVEAMTHNRRLGGHH